MHKNGVSLSIFKCSWNVKNLSTRKNQEPIKMTVSFEHGGKKLFRAWLEMTKSKSTSHPQKYNLAALSFLAMDMEACATKLIKYSALLMAQTRTAPHINKY